MHLLVDLQMAEIGSTLDGSILPHHYAWLLHVQAPRLFFDQRKKEAMSLRGDLQQECGSEVTGEIPIHAAWSPGGRYGAGILGPVVGLMQRVPLLRGP